MITHYWETGRGRATTMYLRTAWVTQCLKSTWFAQETLSQTQARVHTQTATTNKNPLSLWQFVFLYRRSLKHLWVDKWRRGCEGGEPTACAMFSFGTTSEMGLCLWKSKEPIPTPWGYHFRLHHRPKSANSLLVPRPKSRKASLLGHRYVLPNVIWTRHKQPWKQTN